MKNTAAESAERNKAGRMSLLRVKLPPTGSGDAAHVETTADVVLALSSGATALRQRAQRLADNPDADAIDGQAISEGWFEEAGLLEQLAVELRA